LGAKKFFKGEPPQIKFLEGGSLKSPRIKDPWPNLGINGEKILLLLS